MWRVRRLCRKAQAHDNMRQKLGYQEQITRMAWFERVEEEIGSRAGRRNWERAETRERFEFERDVSCCSGDWWWSTKLDFRGGEPFDDPHGPSALGTAIKIKSVFGGGSVLFGKRFWR